MISSACFWCKFRTNDRLLEFVLPVLHAIFFPSHCLLSLITIVDTMESGGRRKNPIATIIIISRKNIGQAKQIAEEGILKTMGI